MGDREGNGDGDADGGDADGGNYLEGKGAGDRYTDGGGENYTKICRLRQLQRLDLECPRLASPETLQACITHSQICLCYSEAK